MEGDCIFCKIAKGQVPCTKIFEDDAILAFRDLHPQAKTHVLIIPKKHFSNLNDLIKDPQASFVYQKIYDSIGQVAKLEGVDHTGYRVVTNVLEGGGQSVFHLHFHLLAGNLSGHFA